MPLKLADGLKTECRGPSTAFGRRPQGSRLIGYYDSQISFGQKPALLVWNRIMLPDVKSTELERQQGVDARCCAGFEAKL